MYLKVGTAAVYCFMGWHIPKPKAYWHERQTVTRLSCTDCTTGWICNIFSCWD